MDRRTFIRGAGVTVGALAAGLGPARRAVAAADGTLPLAWAPTALTPAISHLSIPSDPNTLRGHTTLLPVADKLGADRLDDWYLWQWTHDTSRTYLYTAPEATGPYTARGFGEAPTPYPSNYLTNHFSSGDVVWDPERARFISSPHGVRLPIVPGNAEPSQDSFLTSSVDGLNWEWLDDDNRPRLVCGPPGSVDSIHTGYGRLLRDLDGVLATHAGRCWWIYRAQRLDVGGNPLAPTFRAIGTTYTPYLASASSLAGDFDQKQLAFTSSTANYGLNAFGSFIRASGTHHVYTGQALPDPPIAPGKTLHYRTLGDDMAFFPAPLVPLQIVSTKGAVIEENNIVRDPATGTIYNCHVQGSLNPDLTANVETWIYEGVNLPI